MAFVPTPSPYAATPLPASVVTTPPDVILRTRWLLHSDTYTLPAASTATPVGVLNAAALPAPSLKVALPPPASVVTAYACAQLAPAQPRAHVHDQLPCTYSRFAPLGGAQFGGVSAASCAACDASCACSALMVAACVASCALSAAPAASSVAAEEEDGGGEGRAWLPAAAEDDTSSVMVT